MTKATGRPRGRPKTKEYKSVTIRFPLAFLEHLQRYATLKRQTVSDAMRDGAMLLLADVDPYHPSLLSHTNEDAANLSDRKEEVSDMLSDAKADTVIASDSNTISDIVSDRKEAHPPALDFDAPRLTIPGVPTFLFNPAKHAIGPLCKQ